jgi:hypothetical protein
MLHFMNKTEVRLEFDGTLGSLIDLYLSDPESGFHKLKPSSRHPYDTYAHKIRKYHGSRRIESLSGLDVMRWHEQWRAPVDGGEPRLGAAGMALNVLKCALLWGAFNKNPGCNELHDILLKLRLPTSKPRVYAPDAAAIEGVRTAAHEIGRHSAAFCYALQFETVSRQWDILGKWVPLADPRPSTVLAGGQKWIGPTWAAIDASMILRLTPTKTENTTGKRTGINLNLCPMVIEELASIPIEARTGPLIVNEFTGLPYGEEAFQRVWRIVREAAGLSPRLWNRDIRAGGITEGGEAGASSDDRAKMAGHSSPRMAQKVYDRDVLIGTNRVAEARAKFRAKNAS